jgi:hypothetical protein
VWLRSDRRPCRGLADKDGSVAITGRLG